jgi:class 3 adenylate cyclase
MPFRRSIAYSASEDRLQKLLEERLRAGANKKEIDQRIWDLFGETWCVMVTDLVGFSRGVEEFGIVHFLQTIFESERILVPIAERNDGILLKMDGDSFLVVFRNPEKGLRAAIEMQEEAARYSENREAEEKVILGIGLGYGHVLRIGDADVFGGEVNAAFVLGEDTARAHEILVTRAMRDAIGDAKGYAFTEVTAAKACESGAFRLTTTP